MNNDSGTIQPKLLAIPDILKMLNIGHSTFYSLCSSGKFAPLPVNLCRKVLYQRAEIEAWLAAKCPHRRQWLVMQKMGAG
jgi:predicted DNA-binding transcriptional regulator AlpA